MRAPTLAGLSLIVLLAGAAQGQPRGDYDRGSEPYFVDRPEIILFDRPNFQGKSRRWTDDITDLSDKDFNDKAQSVRVRGRWRVCSDSDNRGHCEFLTRDVADLRSLGLDRTVSSFSYVGRRPEPPPLPPPPPAPAPAPVYPAQGDSLQGWTVGLFLKPTRDGAPLPPSPEAADVYCRRAGYGGALYADYSAPALRDLVCRR